MKRYSKAKMKKRWWLFHASDFQSSMYFCFTFCRIFGMFPYKINASTFETSKLHYILSTLMVCICCIINVKIFYDILISNVIVGTRAKNFEGVCYITCNGFIMISTHILSSPRMHLLQTILKISSKIPPKLYQKLSRLIHTKDILGSIFLIMGMYKYHSITQAMNSTVLFKLIHITSAIYYAMLIFHLNMLYINCICVLKICFKSINDHLEHIQRLPINDTLQWSSTLTCCMQRNQFLLIELTELKKQHLMVSNAVKMLNIIFSPQLLATIVIIFSVMTFELYYLAVHWQNGSLLIGFDKEYFDMVICCLIYYFILLTLLVWACETCKNEAYRINTIIHDLLNNIIDEQMKNELQLFSLQTLHCKNIFSAKGFTVDATLLAEMMGCITIYVLILIQFLIAVHSCDEKNLY